MNDIKAAIFDLDGTLLDTVRDIGFALETVLSKNGLPTHTLDEYKSFLGCGAKKLVRSAVGNNVSDELYNKVYAEYSEHYSAHSEVLTKPFDGIIEVLEKLGKTVKLGVVSNKPDGDTVKLIKKYFPTVPFDAVCGQIEGIPIKPDPTLILMTAEKLGVKPEETVYIGDSQGDVIAATNAGMRHISVLWGYRTKEQLAGAGATNFCEKASELSIITEDLK